MKHIYSSLFLLSLLIGFYFMFTAKSAVQEIQGLIIVLIGVAFVIAAEIRELMEKFPDAKHTGKSKKLPDGES